MYHPCQWKKKPIPQQRERERRQNWDARVVLSPPPTVYSHVKKEKKEKTVLAHPLSLSLSICVCTYMLVPCRPCCSKHWDRCRVLPLHYVYTVFLYVVHSTTNGRTEEPPSSQPRAKRIKQNSIITRGGEPLQHALHSKHSGNFILSGAFLHLAKTGLIRVKYGQLLHSSLF